MSLKQVDTKIYDNCKLIRDAVGGRDNITLLNYCSTRIRLKVIDVDKVNLEHLKQITIIDKVIIKKEFVQLIISNNLKEIYMGLLKALKISYEDVANDFEVSVNKSENIFKKTTDGIAILVKPIIPLLITMGIVATLSNVLTGIDFGVKIGIDTVWITDGVNGTKIMEGSLATLNTFWLGFGVMMKTLSNGIVLAFSMMIPWSVFKLMKGSQAIGISIGIILCFHDLYATSEILSPGQGEIAPPGLFDWDKLYSFINSGYPWKISFAGQILPLVGLSFMAVYFERIAKKFDIPVFKEMVAIPMITILTFFIAMLIVAPLGLIFTSFLNDGLVWATTDKIAKWIFNPLLAILLPLLVVTGLIQVLVVVSLQQFTSFQGQTMMTMFTQLNIAVATSILAVSLIYKKNKEVKGTAVPAYSLAYISGSTEPAIFGIGLKFVYPLVAASIGACAGVLITTAANIICTNGNASLLVFLSITTDPTIVDKFGGPGLAGGPHLWMAVAILVTIVVTFFSTLGLSRLPVFKKISAEALERDFSVQ